MLDSALNKYLFICDFYLCKKQNSWNMTSLSFDFRSHIVFLINHGKCKSDDIKKIKQGFPHYGDQ